MIKTEIISALQNALARGEPIEKAAQSMINAGYNSQEVQSAAAEIQQAGEMGITGSMPVQEASEFMGFPGTPEAPELSGSQTALESQKELEPKKKFPLKIVILISILLVLLGALWFVLHTVL